MKIKSEEISVVVQGNIETCTINTLKSIRRFLPGSEIILSTWKNTDYQTLDYDKIILNDDPGAIEFDLNSKKQNNINRLILSSQSGVSQATRKYILLLRSDLLLVNDNILEFRDNFKRKKSVCLFKKRIFAYELFSMKYEELNGKRYNTFFHISDWCRFGLAEDIKKLYDIKIVKEPRFSLFFKSNIHDKIMDIWPERMWKMSPEQYITSENAKKVYLNLKIKSRLDGRKEILTYSDEFIVNNFIVKSIQEWGIRNQKEGYKNKTLKNYDLIKSGAWLGKNWLVDYQKYCDPNFILPLRLRLISDLRIEQDLKKLRKHLNNFKKPFNLFFRWLNHIISCIYYLARICFHFVCVFSQFLLKKWKK